MAIHEYRGRTGAEQAQEIADKLLLEFFGPLCSAKFHDNPNSQIFGQAYAVTVEDIGKGSEHCLCSETEIPVAWGSNPQEAYERFVGYILQWAVNDDIHGIWDSMPDAVPQWLTLGNALTLHGSSFLPGDNRNHARRELWRMAGILITALAMLGEQDYLWGQGDVPDEIYDKKYYVQVALMEQIQKLAQEIVHT